MKRIKLTVAYDGTNYSGWQIQPNAPTIEKLLDEAIYAVTGENVHVIGASRTDAGVHGMGNVAVFDTDSRIPGNKFPFALNAHLPEDVIIQESRQVSDDFHPRHCNTRKTYEYRILNTKMGKPKERNYSWHVSHILNIEKIRHAATFLVGEHDFKSFCCVKTQAESTVRTIYSIEVLTKDMSSDTDISQKTGERKDQEIIIRVTGNGFLYNMVRIIAGTLVQVGKGQIEPEEIKNMLEDKDRTSAGQTAPPQGLTLMKIDYIDGDDREIIESAE